MITERQLDILKAINEYINQNGYSPSIRELGIAVGINSTSTVHAHLNKLESKEFIFRKDNTPRALVVTEKGMKIMKE